MSWKDYYFSTDTPSNRYYDIARKMGADKFKEFIDREIGVKNYQPTQVTRSDHIFTDKNVSYEKTALRTHRIKIKKFKNNNNINFFGRNNEIDSSVFYDEYRGRRRINVDAHGFLSKNYFGEDVGRITVGGQAFFGDELANFLQDFRRDSPFDCVRLITCHSGEGGKNSLISKVSAALQVPVKGYDGPVLGYDFGYMNDLSKQFGTEKAKDILNEKQMFGRSPGVNEILKGSGRYARQGRTVIAGMEFF